MNGEHWIDRLPRSHITLGDRAVPVYFVLGLSGIVTGAIAALFLSLATGGPAVFMLGAIAAGALVFLVHGLVRRRITGIERLILFETFLAQLLFQGALCFALGVPILPHLDAIAAGLSLFLVFGRVGCLIGGCCYGPVSEFGLRYPPECGAACARHRRFPTQAIEVVEWLALFVGACVLALISSPGRALSFVLIGSGVARLVLETLRADALPRMFGVSYTRVLAAGSVVSGLGVIGVMALERSRAPLGLELGLELWLELGALVAGTAIVVMLVATRARWLSLPAKLDADDLRTLESLGAGWKLASEAPVTQSVRGWTVALSRVDDVDGSALVVSAASSADRSRAEARLVLDAVLAGAELPPPEQIEESERGLFLALIPVQARPEPARTPTRREYFGDPGLSRERVPG